MARKRTSRISIWARIALLIPLPVIAFLIYLSGNQPREGLFVSTAFSDQPPATILTTPVSLPNKLPEADFLLVDTIQFYDADNLYLKIDGHDAAFFRFGFVSLTFADYRGPDSALVDLYVYRLNRRENALGVYAAERSEDRANLQIADTGYRSGGATFIQRGPFYIQIIPEPPGVVTDKAAAEIVEILSKLIPASAAPLAQLARFPAGSRLENSDGYFPDNAFGTDFVGDIYTTEYKTTGNPVTAFYHQSDSARAMFDRYRLFLDGNAEKDQPLTINGVHVYRYLDYGELAWIFTVDDIFAGLSGEAKTEDAIQLVTQLISSFNRGRAE